MDDDLRLRLKELSVTLQNRAGDSNGPGACKHDIAVLMSGVPVTLEALLVLAHETGSPRSGPRKNDPHGARALLEPSRPNALVPAECSIL